MATTSFKLPAVTCTATNGGLVPSLGFSNFTTNEFTSGGVSVQCTGGNPSHGAVAEIDDHFSYLTQNLNAGDNIKVTVTVSASKSTVTISDTTNKSTVKDSISGPGGGGSFTGASVGDSTIGSPSEPIVQLTHLAFAGTQINNATLKAAGTLFGSDLYSGTTLQIKTGAVSTSGTGFTTTFHHV